MPFKKEFAPVFEVIKQAADIADMDVRRIDQEPFVGSIISQVILAIQSADIIVAVVSEENGNVYYEIGLAHCQKKPVVLLTSDPNSLKFDLRDHRAIIYDPNRPANILPHLVKTLVGLTSLSSDPKARIAQSYGSVKDEPTQSGEQALQKITKTIIQAACLQEPVDIILLKALETNDVAIEMKDFFGKRVRAIVDINGIIRILQQY